MNVSDREPMQRPHFRAADGRKPMECKPVLLVTAPGKVIEGMWRWDIGPGLHWVDSNRVAIPSTVTHWAAKPGRIK